MNKMIKKGWQRYTPILAMFLVLFGYLAQAANEEPLPPEQAFQFSATTKNADTLIATWEIADGYYLYKSKFKFVSETPEIQLGEPIIPDGKKKKDEFFGEVETFRKTVSIEIPIQRQANAPAQLTLLATSQGCADIGICYPPYQHTAMVSLAPAPTSASTANETSGNPIEKIAELGASLGLAQEEEEFLDPEVAFVLSTEVVDANTILARWQIADGYYLYKDKLKFILKDAPAGVRLGTVQLPDGKIKQDEFFGELAVFYKSLEARIPIQRAAGKSVMLDIGYQGCAEAGLCYPPIVKTIALNLPSTSPATADVATTPEPAAAQATAAEDSGKPTPATKMPDETASLSTSGYLWAIISAFGIGVLLSFTPCVLPMIPILSSIIVGQGGETITKSRGGTLALVYVLGTSVTYTAAGIMAGLSGDQLQAYFQNVWGIGILSGILVLLSLSMFGLYEIQMPSFIQSRLQEKSQNIKSGGFAGVFVMGLFSSLIVGACVSPLLISALSVAIALKDPVLGGLIMFAMAMGMGVLLIMIGVGAGAVLPKAGAWMDNVKYVFGVMLLGVAIYLLGILEFVPVLYLWGALFIVTGVYMGATQSLPNNASGWRYLIKGFGTLALIWGIFALLGGFMGQRDILHPMPMDSLAGAGTVMPVSASSQADAHDSLFTQLSSEQDLDKELAAAKAAKQFVMLDYFATWCTDCIRMEKGTFSDPTVAAYLKQHFRLLQVDVTDQFNENTNAIKKRFNVFGPPAILFFDKNGTILTEKNFYGYKKADAFLAHLKSMVEAN